MAAVQSALIVAHDVSGLPWWATIVAGTLTMRAFVLPAVIYQQRQHARFAQIRPLLRAVGESCQHIQSNPRRQAAALTGMWRVCVENGVHPLSLFAGALVQLPVFLICIFSVRRLLAAAREAAAAESTVAAGEAAASASAAGFTDGGMLWFADLTAADPTAALPLLTLGTFLLTTEASNRQNRLGSPAQGGAGAAAPPARGLPLWLEYFRKRLQDVGVIALPAMATLPAGVFMYWLPNNLVSLAQGAVLRSEWARTHPLLAPPPPKRLQAAAAGGGVRASARGVMMAQARALEERGEVQAAAETYRSLIREEPADADAVLGLVKLLLLSGSAEAHAMAVAVLRPLVAMKPNERRASLALAGALDRVGDRAEAEATLGARLALAPDDVQARIALAAMLARPMAAVDGAGGAGTSRLDAAIAELARAAQDARAVGDVNAASWCEREVSRLQGRGSDDSGGAGGTPPS